MQGLPGSPRSYLKTGKHEFTVAPVCMVAYFPRETLHCLVQKWRWKMFGVTQCDFVIYNKRYKFGLPPQFYQQNS